jgi:3',5'-cyclic AMP phosphodiesterase CpdA
MLTLAQITDLHITAGDDLKNSVRNEARLRATLKTIHEMRPRPAAILASGDLVDFGRLDEYLALAAILASAEIPIYLGIGNHDRRAGMLEVFRPPLIRTDRGGFIQYAVEFDGLRVIMCDTVKEGQSEGDFCEARADWLAETLDAAPETPTIIVVHHPPVASGIQWMDPVPGAAWIGRLGGVLRGRSQILTTLCGHVHRSFHGRFAGHLVSVSSATALQLTLDMTPVDMTVADGRQILLGEPPGFTLLSWDGAELTTHACVAGDFPDQIHYVTPFAKG